MRTSILGVAFAALPQLAAGFETLEKRAINDPVARYLSEMCYPLLSNRTRSGEYSANGLLASLVNSPFPCEQESYFRGVCNANGTEEIDFLAEQQCLCNGAFFDVVKGCHDCHLVHGYQNYTAEEASSSRSSLSAAECTPSPPYQPYTNLLPPLDASAARARPNITLGNDRFPNDTAVSNYFTATQSITPGEITGSATGRVRSWTNTGGFRYTPMSTPSSTGTSSASSSTKSASQDAASSNSASTSQTATGNIAAKSGVGGAGYLVGIGLGAVAYL